MTFGQLTITREPDEHRLVVRCARCGITLIAPDREDDPDPKLLAFLEEHRHTVIELP